MESLVLNGTEIRVDEFDRYCLTDLWKASGLGNDKKPGQFARYEGCKRVIEKLKVLNHTFEPMVTTRGKYTGGTWAVKHLVYKYAMWVDVDFEINVIDVFDSAASGHGDMAVAIAQNNEDLKALIDKRDNLILTASTQSERNEIERLTNEISKYTKPSAQKLAMMRGKGKKFAESELERINLLIQLDMFKGELNG